MSAEHPNYRTKYCIRRDSGCNYKDCTYAHTDSELRPTMCRFGYKCRNKTCSWYHPDDIIDRQEVKIRALVHEAVIKQFNQLCISDEDCLSSSSKKEWKRNPKENSGNGGLSSKPEGEEKSLEMKPLKRLETLGDVDESDN
jgi:hypothetical protein